ncbi:MAG TPA: 2-phosphosulfolactate phosphatase [Kofleriaceae bacterium]|nr:2-phosphosulfolactate phosphatase [Kofleriaceae bacterium]
MKIDIVGPEAVSELREVVVIIDVLRAFTTAAYAFASGASEIVLVAGVDEALALRQRSPGALLVGEIDGYPIDGFDHGNSPHEISRRAFAGARLIQRTTSGTCAAIDARHATELLAASFVCAEATVRHILGLEPAHVGLVLSGRRGDVGGVDDLACASYLMARLRGEDVPAARFLAEVRDCKEAVRFHDRAQDSFPIEDLELALELDRFDFAMAARRRDGLLVLERVDPPPARAA